MARKNYDKMFEEKEVEATPVEEPVVEEEVVEEKVVEEPKVKRPFMATVVGGLSLNVRKSPNGDIIATVPEGAQIRVLEQTEDSNWYKIESPEGFVMKKFVKKG